ncbi:MAG: complex I NDUFA9 subunit family protein [Magnetospirillum gryphiswaldense]|nr:complex I NDUFA9 subunit family protein [Magnetospirillum gryphiswaldense]
MTRNVVTIFGGSGFIGRHVVKRFAKAGWIVRAAMRDPIAGGFLKTMGEPGQVIPIRVDVTDKNAVRDAVQGAQCVVNMVGILFEKGKRRFDAIHTQAAATVAQAAAAAGAATLVHMSALGADKGSTSAYARSKALGEEAVLAAFPAAVIIRPSVVFGPDDDFFNRFAALARMSPVLPVFTQDGFKLAHSENGMELDLFGSGGTTFQPVHVGDVAEAIFRAAGEPAAAGKTYELGGPRRYTMKEIMETVLAGTGLKRWLLPLPFAFAGIQAAFLQFLPKPPLTPDQVALMRTDNVVRGGKPGLAELGITATACEAVVPSYLARYAPTS